PFHEVGIDFRHRAEASELARSNHPLQGAGEHRGELRSLEPLSEPGGFGFTFRRQREIGQSRVLVRDGPGRLPVPGQVYDRKRVAHDWFPLLALMPRIDGDVMALS